MLLQQLADLPQPSASMKKYYVIYCRKSTESEDKQLQSIDDQIRILTQLAHDRNLHILKVFTEEKSAKAPGRPIFNEMLALIQSRKDIKGILAWKLNRLSRNPVDSGTLQWIIQNKTIEEIVTPSKIYLDADSDFIMSVEGAQANRYIRDLREDTLRGINSKIEKGHAPIKAPVGYRNTLERPKGLREIVPHDIYFPLVRKIMDMALTDQYSLLAIGFEAQRLGILTAQGKMLSEKHIQSILTNPFYAGRYLYTGKLYLGKHQRMVTDKEFDLIQKYVQRRGRARNTRYPLTGSIQCVCGFMITGTTRKKVYSSGKKANFVYYRCTQHIEGKCNQPPISEHDLENQVKNFLSSIKLSPRLVEWAIKQMNTDNKQQLQTKQAQIRALTQNLETIRKKLENLFNLKVDPRNEDGSLITDDEYLTMRQKLLIEREDTNQEIRKTETITDDWMTVAVNCFNFASRALEKWEKGTVEERRIILHAIGASLVLNNKRLEITPRSMFKAIQEATQAQGSSNDSLVHLIHLSRTLIPSLPQEELHIYRSF